MPLYRVHAELEDGYGRRDFVRVGRPMVNGRLAVKVANKYGRAYVINGDTGKPIYCKGFKSHIETLVNEIPHEKHKQSSLFNSDHLTGWESPQAKEGG